MFAGLDAIGGFVQGGTAGSLSVALSDDIVTKTGSTTGGSKTLVTAPVTAAPSGGASPYSYAWTRIAGDTGITATAPSSSSTSFSATLPPNGEKSAVFRCTVTDASGATAIADVSVDIELVSFA